MDNFNIYNILTSSNTIMYQTCNNYFYYKNISPISEENQNNHENIIDCPICFNKSTDIIIFSCEHAICLQCLQF